MLVKERLPFLLVKSPSFQNLIHFSNKNYKIPSYKTVQKKLLNSCFQNHQMNMMEELRRAQFIAVCFDGWQNVVRNKIVNVVACIRYPLLLCSVRVDESLDSEMYKQIVWKAIVDHGIDLKVVQVMSDGENTVDKARRLLQVQSRIITSSYCKSHGLNLLIKDLMDMDSINRIRRFLVKILKRIKYSSVLRRKAEERSDMLGHPSLPKVVLPPATRWSFWFETLHYAASISDVLSLMAKTGDFTHHRDDKSKPLTQDEQQILHEMETNSFWKRIRAVSGYL